MTNEPDILKDYRALKERLGSAKDAVDDSEGTLQKIDAIREEVYNEISGGDSPSAQKLAIALYGLEMAIEALKRADAEWLDISRKLAEMVAQIQKAHDKAMKITAPRLPLSRV